DAHPYEVAILAVVIDPFLDQRLVGEPAVAGIDDALVPALALRAEYDSVELAAVARGIAPGEDHGLAIGQATFGRGPDLVGDCRSLVEEIPGGRACGMLPVEGFRILAPAGLRAYEPALRRRIGIDPLGAELEPVRRNAQ